MKVKLYEIVSHYGYGGRDKTDYQWISQEIGNQSDWTEVTHEQFNLLQNYISRKSRVICEKMHIDYILVSDYDEKIPLFIEDALKEELKLIEKESTIRKQLEELNNGANI
jgi:hypothetical protein